jgi:hypothetical protein
LFVLPIGIQHIVAGYRQRTPDYLASGPILGPVLLVGTASAEFVGNLHGQFFFCWREILIGLVCHVQKGTQVCRIAKRLAILVGEANKLAWSIEMRCC